MSRPNPGIERHWQQATGSMVRWQIRHVHGNQHPINSIPRVLHRNDCPCKHRVYTLLSSWSDLSWASIGIGHKMAHSLMFIITQNKGNVSLSVRLTPYNPHHFTSLTCRDYHQPTEVKNVTATLEQGTGVNDSYITANIHVQSGGLFWAGGNLNVASSNQDFIYGFSPNTPSGGSASGSIVQHVVVGSFQLDLGAAIGTGGMPTIVSPVTSWGWQSIVLAHAVMMGIAWVGLLPAGAIIIRFLGSKVKNPVLVHQILQLASMGFVFIAFFVGVGTSSSFIAFTIGASTGQQFKFGHQWLGGLVCFGLLIQAALGWYHHKRYVQDKPTSRRWFTHVHLWLGRFLLFFALITIGLGIQLYGDGAAAQAMWYIFTIIFVAAYGFFYWRIHLQRRKRINDAFDPSPFEDPTNADNGAPKVYEPYRPINVAAMNDNDLGTYRSEYYDPDESGVNEYGARVQTGNTATITAVNRPGTAVPSTSAGRRYDTPTVPGPYRPTEPLRPVQSDPQLDPFADPYRPRTGRSQAPYPSSMASAEESMPSVSAPPYPTSSPSYDRRHFV